MLLMKYTIYTHTKCYIMKNSQLTFPEVVKWLQIWSNLIVLINLNLKKSSKILKFSIKKSVTYKLMERNVLLIPPNIFWFPVNSDERILFTFYYLYKILSRIFKGVPWTYLVFMAKSSFKQFCIWPTKHCKI
jgi:hypothetical protein